MSVRVPSLPGAVGDVIQRRRPPQRGGPHLRVRRERHQRRAPPGARRALARLDICPSVVSRLVHPLGQRQDQAVARHGVAAAAFRRAPPARGFLRLIRHQVAARRRRGRRCEHRATSQHPLSERSSEQMGSAHRRWG